MTRLQASKTAKKLWGKKACIERTDYQKRGRIYKVGYMELGFFNVIGEGKSWDESINDAKKKMGII